MMENQNKLFVFLLHELTFCHVFFPLCCYSNVKNKSTRLLQELHSAKYILLTQQHTLLSPPYMPLTSSLGVGSELDKVGLAIGEI